MTRECKWMGMEVGTYRHRGAYFLHIFYFIWVAIFQFCNRNKKEPLNTCHEMIFAEVNEISSHLQGPLPFCSILFYEVLKIEYTERKQKVHWFSKMNYDTFQANSFAWKISALSICWRFCPRGPNINKVSGHFQATDNFPLSCYHRKHIFQ